MCLAPPCEDSQDLGFAEASAQPQLPPGLRGRLAGLEALNADAEVRDRCSPSHWESGVPSTYKPVMQQESASHERALRSM